MCLIISKSNSGFPIKISQPDTFEELKCALDWSRFSFRIGSFGLIVLDNFSIF